MPQKYFPESKSDKCCIGCNTYLKLGINYALYDKLNHHYRCTKCKNESDKKYKRGLKAKIFKHYGNICECCGESELMFLCIDHINNDGNKHRRKVGQGGTMFQRFIINNNYPKDLRILCFNCNWGRFINKGICPHKGKKL